MDNVLCGLNRFILFITRGWVISRHLGEDVVFRRLKLERGLGAIKGFQRESAGGEQWRAAVFITVCFVTNIVTHILFQQSTRLITTAIVDIRHSLRLEQQKPTQILFTHRMAYTFVIVIYDNIIVFIFCRLLLLTC